LSYLFSEYCIHWPHHVPIRDKIKFHRSQNIEEVIGAIPVWTTSVDDRISEARVVLEKAKLWSQGFRPYFPENWEKGVVSYLRNPQGRLVKYYRPEDSSYCLEETRTGEKLVYGRVTGTSSLELKWPVSIDGWLAYNEKGPIGLNPDDWYCIFPGKSPKTPVKIDRITDGLFISGIRLTDRYCLVQIGGKGEGKVSWKLSMPEWSLYLFPEPLKNAAGEINTQAPSSLLFGQIPVQTRLEEIIPLETWQASYVNHGQLLRLTQPVQLKQFSLAGKRASGYQVFPPVGGKEAEFSLDGFLQLPQTTNLALSFNVGRLGGAGDGVNLTVRLNGQEIWREFSEPNKRGWTPVRVSLEKYAGQTVLISLAVDCGPSGYNTSNDQTVWSEVKLVGQ
ncbi:MAG: hypothetical protein NC911_10740, partial [Candidatus Omnitrophica bacterium]|nr:hypothetical protein [Candidatus Omnitrophota bacterium]